MFFRTDSEIFNLVNRKGLIEWRGRGLKKKVMMVENQLTPLVNTIRIRRRTNLSPLFRDVVKASGSRSPDKIIRKKNSNEWKTVLQSEFSLLYLEDKMLFHGNEY